MIDRVELQRIIGYIADVEERKKTQAQEKKEEAVKVEIPQELRNTQKADYEDLERKVEGIKDQLRRGSYEVSPEKILIGLEKYLFSK
ncbi:MAG: flagellar biosynthesis anti-sigma factor FlgM [Aquificaceae bacterium]